MIIDFQKEKPVLRLPFGHFYIKKSWKEILNCMYC
jgi:hypothetical protein